MCVCVFVREKRNSKIDVHEGYSALNNAHPNTLCLHNYRILFNNLTGSLLKQ